MSSRRPSPPEPESAQLLRIATALGGLAERLRDDSEETLAESVVTATIDVVPETRWCSISVLQAGGFRSLAASDDVALRLDGLQYELGEGPCIAAALDDTVYVIRDLARDPRWPTFSRRAASLGAASILGFRLNLLTGAETVAGLNLYSDVADAFGEESLWIGSMMSTFASLGVSLALSRARTNQLEAALRSNREIALAMGVLMGRHGATREQAFDLLRLASQDTNRKMSQIADDVITTGSLSLSRRLRHGRQRPATPPQDDHVSPMGVSGQERPSSPPSSSAGDASWSRSSV